MADVHLQVAGQYVDVDTGRALGHCHDMLPLTVGQCARLAGSGKGAFYVAGGCPLLLGRVTWVSRWLSALQVMPTSQGGTCVLACTAPIGTAPAIPANCMPMHP